MKNTRRLVLLLALLFPVTETLAQCDPVTDGVDVILGFDSKYENEPVFYPFSEPWSLQLVWVPDDERVRDRQKYFIEADPRAETVSPVMAWDGELRRVLEGEISPVALGDETEWPGQSLTGTLHLKICPEVLRSAGPPLFYVYFGIFTSSGEILIWSDEPRVTPLIRNTTNSDLEVSQIIRTRFNEGLKQRVRDDVATVTGVTPGDFLAQNLFFQHMTFLEGLLDFQPLVFMGSRFYDTLVLRDRIYLISGQWYW